ncbi:MAG: hypothetical protein QOG20_6012 [Pseudonocardiales bacterium]|nr:hypothetical protein [Pseudonocardiales bacterium]
MASDTVAASPAAHETAAAEVASRVLRTTVRRAGRPEVTTLVHGDGRQSAFDAAAVGERADLSLAHLRRQSEIQWPAPARWWWQVSINDVRRMPRVREVFPVAARACEANGVRRPGQLPGMVTITVPDLHWLVHNQPASLVGDPVVLDRPTTVTLGRGRPADRGMTSVGPALNGWLADEAAARALGRLGRRRTEERHLYLTISCTADAADAFEALVRASGVPPAAPPDRPGVSHLWLAPVLGPAVFLWSRQDGWSRHEPYS